MNNREVCHLWANQARTTAKGSNLFFDGRTLYSYGHHFPVASIFTVPDTGETVALFNRRRYSNSTSRHQSYARHACAWPIHYVRQADATTQPRSAAHLAEMVQAAAKEEGAENDEKRRRALERARQRRAEKKRTAEAMAAFPAELAAWRAGGPVPRAGFITGTALRLSPNRPGMIETCRDAYVPASVARKAWPILAAAVAAEEANPGGQAWTPFFSRPDWNWGDYKGIELRRVALGSPVTLRVGCHEIPWREIEAMAAALGLIRETATA